MSDLADKASFIEQRERDTALALHSRPVANEAPFAIEGRRVCLDCFEPIGRQRLKANPNAVRCVECQRDSDRRLARGLA